MKPPAWVDRADKMGKLLARASWKGMDARDVVVAARFDVPPRPGPAKLKRMAERLRGVTAILDELYELRRIEDELRAALAPFAAFCLMSPHERQADDFDIATTEQRVVPGGPVVTSTLTVGMFRRARALVPEAREAALRGNVNTEGETNG